jgi:hypothetical protein
MHSCGVNWKISNSRDLHNSVDYSSPFGCLIVCRIANFTEEKMKEHTSDSTYNVSLTLDL